MAPALFRNSLRIADQGGQALGNMAVTVMLARTLSVDSFAIVATALTVWIFFSTLQRNGIIVPYIADVPDPKDSASSESTWFAVNALFCAASCLTLVIAGGLAPGLLGQGLKYSSLLVLFAGLHFFSWRVLYHRGRTVAACMVSLLSVGLLLAFAAAMYFREVPPNVSNAVGIYVLAYGGSFVCGLFLVSPSMPKLKKAQTFYHQQKDLIGVMSLGALFANFYNNGIQLVLAAIANAIEIAAFAATRVFVGPINLIVVAITDMERSNAARRYHEYGQEALMRSTNRTLLTVATIIFPVGLALLWYSAEMLEFLYGSKFNEFVFTAQMWVVALIPQILAIPFDIQQSIQKQGKKLLAARMIGALAAAATLIAVYITEGELQAWTGVLAIACGRLLSLTTMYINSRRFAG